MKFIVKLFPEITIKSKPVRTQFVKKLRRNIRTLLKTIDSGVDVQGVWDRVEVVTSSDDSALCQQVVERLGNTPGIAHILEVSQHRFETLHDLFELTLAEVGDSLEGKTFCVRASRSGNHEFTSHEAERYVGGGLNQHTEATGVKLKDPDVVVRLEIRQKTLSIVRRRHEGLGGFPLGTQDPVLSLISGGFDSTVSSFLMTKRGVNTHFCFFNLGGKAHEVGVKEVAYYLWNKFGASHRVMFVTVPFEAVVAEILTEVDNSQMGVVLKRMMLRAASQIAEEMEIEALVTGEAIAQVSSQTLPNLSVIDSVTDQLVLRPLIAMDKQDIIDISRRIGTEEFASHMPEYCGVISVNPTTRARKHRVEREEERFDMAVLEKAVRERKAVPINHIVGELGEQQRADEAQQVDTGEVVIDIRHPTEQELRPLRLTDVEVLYMPFYELHSRFAELDAGREYLLYCEKGVMSQLHAMHLRDEGFANVKVYRP
ncbi:tRNA 4-thiouridine(8) synthase ThiI [Aestuariirhabdus sp. Z084]|uniref:tRNA uracil 4-sulfurtransferase ThiI n=1 Tax=Aestuariirhabdus haliotis TaxID=2918751 RepID=UPI00201B3CF5|nr:tRNA uracil 4-sulfurtransferase ThiI [Aestuariirhabdus haliotis]MCL6414981.1 tRNA 4-thiouridine(8) synthase ThiI [Aestuariirhabdus haliotis]MCL6418913.1 tRNA 4-thiouridine(8) synthase ThiI [Aestuariirhabdus haliotis]